MGSSPRTSGTRVMAVPAGEECSVPSAGRKPARCPHRHADQPVNSFQPRGGRRPRRPDDRRTSSYISNRQRQRRKGEADSKLRIRFTGNPACRPGRKSRNRRLLAHLLVTFCAYRKSPAGGKTSRFYRHSYVGTNRPSDALPELRKTLAQKLSCGAALAALDIVREPAERLETAPRARRRGYTPARNSRFTLREGVEDERQ